MKIFSARLTGLLSILLILAVYQLLTMSRANAEEVAQLQNELTESQNQLNELVGASGSGGSYKDGTYTGEAQGYGGPIAVTVTVSDGQITDIDITSHSGEDAAYYALASNITTTMISQQSTDVSTISGATLSSTGIKNAVISALEEAQ